MKKYETPIMELLEFNGNDVVTTSDIFYENDPFEMEGLLDGISFED